MAVPSLGYRPTMNQILFQQFQFSACIDHVKVYGAEFKSYLNYKQICAHIDLFRLTLSLKSYSLSQI